MKITYFLFFLQIDNGLKILSLVTLPIAFAPVGCAINAIQQTFRTAGVVLRIVNRFDVYTIIVGFFVISSRNSVAANHKIRRQIGFYFSCFIDGKRFFIKLKCSIIIDSVISLQIGLTFRKVEFIECYTDFHLVFKRFAFGFNYRNRNNGLPSFLMRSLLKFFQPENL